MFKKNDRVRIYSYELGNLYGTVMQDEQIAGGRAILTHIDGTRTVDCRWIRTENLDGEHFRGEYARTRVSECTLDEK